MENITDVIIMMFVWWLGYVFGRRKERENTLAELFPAETRIYITEKGKSWRPEKN